METNNVRYGWVANSNDDAYRDSSDTTFATEKEAYDSMRRAALHKMTWNTQFDEDFTDVGDDDYIHYEVTFSPRRITHESYSGKYVYQIYKVEF